MAIHFRKRAQYCKQINQNYLSKNVGLLTIKYQNEHHLRVLYPQKIQIQEIMEQLPLMIDGSQYNE